MGQVFTDRDVSRWHWRDAIEGALACRISGFVAEADQELRRKYFSNPIDAGGRQVALPNAFIVPNEVVRRDLTAASASGGGYLVSTENVGFLDALAPMLVTAKLGARRLSGLVGSVTVPRVTANSTAYWLANEATAVTESQPTFGQLVLAPKVVGAYTEVSRQLLLQSAVADKVVGNAVLRPVAVAIDAAALNGSGASGQPQGIIGTAGVGAFTGTSIDYPKLVDAQTDLASNNVDVAQAAYCTTPAIAATLMARQRFTSVDSPLWQGPMGDGIVAGLRSIASTQVPTATMVCGKWDHLILAEWGAPLQIEVNPFANFQAGIVGVRAMALVDVGVEYAAAFSVASSIT